MLLNKELTRKVIKDIIKAIKEGMRKWQTKECSHRR